MGLATASPTLVLSTLAIALTDIRSLPTITANKVDAHTKICNFNRSVCLMTNSGNLHWEQECSIAIVGRVVRADFVVENGFPASVLETNIIARIRSSLSSLLLMVCLSLREELESRKENTKINPASNFLIDHSCPSLHG